MCRLYAILGAGGLALGAAVASSVGASSGSSSFVQSPPQPGETAPLIFPIYRESSDVFAGFAFTNFETVPFTSFGFIETVPSTNFETVPRSLSFEVRTDDGSLLPAAVNPATVIIDPGQQLARLGTELIGSSPAGTKKQGWARVAAGQSRAAGFFLQGEVAAGGIERLDGAAGLEATTQRYCFSRVYQGLQVFPSFSGPRNAVTTLALVNPDPTSAEVRLRLFNPQAQLLARVDRLIPGRGRLRADIGELFEEDALSDHYVCVEHLSGRTAGLELIRLPEAILMLAGRVPGDGVRSFSAQLAHGRDIFTSLKLVNPGALPQSVTVTAFLQDGQGNISSRVRPLVLSPGQSLQRGVDRLFALGPGASTPLIGSLQVDATPGGILGDVIFGDPQALSFAAALPLQEAAFSEAIFSHLANGPTNLADPSFDPFTGLAVFNPNQSVVRLEVTVFAPDGSQVGSTRFQLPARGHFAELVEFLIPASSEMSAGFVRLQASQPVVAQQIFGNTTLQFLAAIPARPFCSQGCD